MSPRSRNRSSGDPAWDGPTPSNEISAIFDGMLRHARELLAVRSPLDAELIVSEILGSWWGQRVPDGDVEEVIGEALVAHAAPRARRPRSRCSPGSPTWELPGRRPWPSARPWN
ncbi:hypothetical protein LUX57_14675 [Actinomadura madurae]|uniref:hypothetical protein n=1 Tax=Actinomadura madurae TaxID=1993 RepID=UPI0020D2616B|nr:hypothetical protein [Actinomadura madurae]MCP9966198.1 hypothetical protein [Actinomadura madurae]